MNTIYKFSPDQPRITLKQDFLKIIHLVLDRFENCLILPLNKYDLVIQ